MPVLHPDHDALFRYKFELTIARHEMQAFKVLIRRMKSEVWQEAAFGASLPLTVAVKPNPFRSAIDKNQPVGVPAAGVYATIDP